MSLKDKSLRQDLLTGIVVILCIAMLEGLYAVQLNSIYYSTNSPFYDSVSYYNQLALVMEAVKSGHLITALQKATVAANTCLPFLIAIVAGFFIEPSRAVGVWLQTLWLAVLGISVFFYLRKFNINNLWLSVALTLPLMGIAALWYFNGGLSDFRMDLHLYLFMGISFSWYLCTYHTNKRYPWLISGISIGLTCLARTIAPVYFIVSLGLLLVVRFIYPENIKRSTLAKNAGLMILLATLVCGWFYIVGFDNMYYYYVVWNLDANAKLPISQAAQHFDLAFKSIGWFPIVFAVFLLPFTLSTYFKDRRNFNPLQQIDWKILWLGLAPVLFLVLRGAGPNSFVSMPAAFGLVLFGLKPLKASEDRKLFQNCNPSSILLITLVSISLMTAIAISGVSSHLLPDPYLRGGMPACKEILATILKDSETKSAQEITFSTSYISSLNDDVLWNVSVYDGISDQGVSLNSSHYLFPKRIFNQAAPADWDAVPGNNDTEKINYLVKTANQSLDYLILPERRTAQLLKNTRSYISINVFAPRIRELFQQGDWVAISPRIKIYDDEFVKVYRNVQRAN